MTRDDHDERRLDEAAGALRDSAQTEPVPPDLRRDTLQALWAADAERYEASAAKRSRLVRTLVGVAATVVIVAAGVVGATLISRSWSKVVEREMRNTPQPPGWQVTAPPTATAPTTQELTAVAGGSVVALGKVTFAGEPPAPQQIDLSGSPECRALHPSGLFDDSLIVSAEGGVANVVVSLRAAGDRSLAASTPPAQPAFLDQRGCRFVPRVLAVAVGQPIFVKNGDAFLHNVHSLAVDNPAFNFGQPGVNPGTRIGAMTVAERFAIKCDVHPWMRASVSVFEHPYFTVTASDGSFAIPGSVPDGRYLLVAWHERLGELQAPIQVKGGIAVLHDFQFDPSAVQ